MCIIFELWGHGTCYTMHNNRCNVVALRVDGDKQRTRTRIQNAPFAGYINHVAAIHQAVLRGRVLWLLLSFSSGIGREANHCRYGIQGDSRIESKSLDGVDPVVGAHGRSDGLGSGGETIAKKAHQAGIKRSIRNADSNRSETALQ